MLGILKLLSHISEKEVQTMLARDDPWPLVVFLPGVMLGLVLGLMAASLLAWSIPPLRRAFDNESRETGRPGFRRAMSSLAKTALVLGGLAVTGCALFLRQA